MQENLILAPAVVFLLQTKRSSDNSGLLNVSNKWQIPNNGVKMKRFFFSFLLFVLGFFLHESSRFKH